MIDSKRWKIERMGRFGYSYRCIMWRCYGIAWSKLQAVDNISKDPLTRPMVAEIRKVLAAADIKLAQFRNGQNEEAREVWKAVKKSKRV